MRILFIHNRYGVPSGEEFMITRIIAMLRDNNHEVETFFRDSHTIVSPFDKIHAFFSGIWSFSARRHLKQKLVEFNPDIVQIQNLYPLISPSILPLLRNLGYPVVMRLSNYRLVCPTGLFLSHGEVCERCRGGREYWCVLKNCERNLFKSFGYGLRNWVARRFHLYSGAVNRYYAQTGFQKNLLVAEGFTQNKFSTIPNMVEQPDTGKVLVDGTFVGFVGRMSHEKGIDVFLNAARLCPQIPFKVAGAPRTGNENKELPDNVELLGHLERTALNEFYRNCRLVVVPSVCYEGFPGAIIEAMGHAKPVIASRIGGIPEIVEEGKTGILFTPGNANELATHITSLWGEREKIKKYGLAGQKKVKNQYTSKIYYRALMKTYQQAIAEVARER